MGLATHRCAPLVPGGVAAVTDEPGLLTVAEVAALLRVSKMTVYRLAKAGTIHSIRVGRGIRIGRASVEKIMGELWPTTSAK